MIVLCRRSHKSQIVRTDRRLKTLTGIEVTETAESFAQESSRERNQRNRNRNSTVREEPRPRFPLRHYL